MIAEESKQKDADGLREMGGEGVEAEEAEAEGDEPVGERGFFEVADAVDVEGDESPVRAMWRAALAWVPSASSSSGGAKREAKKMMSQRPLRSEQSGGASGVPESVERRLWRRVSRRVLMVMSWSVL